MAVRCSRNGRCASLGKEGRSPGTAEIQVNDAVQAVSRPAVMPKPAAAI
jgi:hypothetical protein